MKGKVIEEPSPPPGEKEQEIPLETLTISENTADKNDIIEDDTVNTEAGAYIFHLEILFPSSPLEQFFPLHSEFKVKIGKLENTKFKKKKI